MLESSFDVDRPLKIGADREYPDNMTLWPGGLRLSRTVELPNPRAKTEEL